MPYALRNEAGNIIALTAKPSFEGEEPIELNDPDVLSFMIGIVPGNADQRKFNELLAEDLKQIRIVEDLIDLLTSKGIILFSDLPEAAQSKILDKKSRRDEMNQSNDILVDAGLIF